jgi:hypothetical protein
VLFAIRVQFLLIAGAIAVQGFEVAGKLSRLQRTGKWALVQYRGTSLIGAG